jgi:hypothetical protein
VVPVIACLLGIAEARAQDQVGSVTLVAGAPRMVGESIRPLQAIYSGRVLETGDADAAGMLLDDIVVHMGINSRVTVTDEAGRKHVQIERGFVVVYTDPATRNEVVVETPFGVLSSIPGTIQNGGTGWYSVRHDLEKVGVSPAASTFAAMEGTADVVGTAPGVGPYTLQAGQRWRIVQGQVPGPPEEGDERAGAEELSRMLHYEAAELAQSQLTELPDLAGLEIVGPVELAPFEVPEGQFIIDSDAAVQLGAASPLASLIPLIPIIPILLGLQPDFAFAEPAVIAPGPPTTATAQFVSYAGTPVDPNFNDFLTAVDGNPAFQPQYLTQFANGGFSYLQFAGPDAQTTQLNGETFFARPPGETSGWATYTPFVAVGDPDFDAQSPMVAVVSDGFAAIARGDHLDGGGTIGGNGDPASAFAVVSGGNVQLNPNQPAGYPQLDRASDTTGLTVGGQAVSDQIAALGAGRNPQQLSQPAQQLVFLSSSNVDSLGNSFNFDGDPITPTNLNLPDTRPLQTDATGAAGVATPLSADPNNTVGVQFAATGQTVAIIHHTGLEAGGIAFSSEHFEVIRGSRFSIVQWRAGGRVTAPGGQTLEFEDLNGDPTLRNELFGVLCQEVNAVMPANQQTLCGPALTSPGATLRHLRLTPGQLVRQFSPVTRRYVDVRRTVDAAATRPLRVRSLTPAGGRLVRVANATPRHRYVGRATAQR